MWLSHAMKVIHNRIYTVMAISPQRHLTHIFISDPPAVRLERGGLPEGLAAHLAAERPRPHVRPERRRSEPKVNIKVII